MGANPSPYRCPILAQPGRGPTTAKSPSVDDWTCDFQGVVSSTPPQPVGEPLAQRQTRKASHSRKNGVNPEPLRARRLWELNIRYHGLAPWASTPVVRQKTGRSRTSPVGQKHASTIQGHVPVWTICGGRAGCEKSSASSKSFACASRVVRLGNLKMFPIVFGTDEC